MSIRFDEQVVIVTGAGAGLGRAHALEFARRGARVIVNDLGPKPDGSGGPSEAAASVVGEIEGFGGTAIAHGASVTDEAGVADMVKTTMDRFGRIDVLVNNAGILGDKSFHNMTVEGFRRVLDVHLMGTVIATHAVWPIMREQAYGRVVVTTSSSGLYGNFGQSNYGAGKMGVLGLMTTLKLEGEKYNVRISALAPTAWTQMTADIFPPDAEQVFQAEKVTPAVIFLAGPDAPNGVILCAGAGGYARAAMVETPGIFLGVNATAEDVAAHWETISDFSETIEHKAGLDQPQKMTKLYQSG
ncbi:MAG: SDR family NAD(P)-dependent oxidoreductase [Pseudomonadota bacterium]